MANIMPSKLIKCMYSQFLRSVTARGSCTGPVTLGPTKVFFIASTLKLNNRFHSLSNIAFSQ